jgi:hypothetical protein
MHSTVSPRPSGLEGNRRTVQMPPCNSLPDQNMSLTVAIGDLSPEDREFRIKVMMRTVGEATAIKYINFAKVVEEVAGAPASYATFIRYLRLKPPKSAQTALMYKSGITWYLRLMGTPLSPAEDEDLNHLMRGFTVLIGRAPQVRGAPTPAQVLSLLTHLMVTEKPTLCIAGIIGFGCCLRPRDLVGLCPASVDPENKVVWVERKVSVVTKARRGAFEAKPINTPEALEALVTLRSRVLEAEGEAAPLLPGFRPAEASKAVREFAESEGWDPHLLWDGYHSVCRHGYAAEQFRMNMEQLRRSAGWQGERSHEPYTKQARTVPQALRTAYDRKRARASSGEG